MVCTRCGREPGENLISVTIGCPTGFQVKKLQRPRWKLGEHDRRGGILAVEFEEIERVEDRISNPCRQWSASNRATPPLPADSRSCLSLATNCVEVDNHATFRLS
jgi:hypothetical protein